MNASTWVLLAIVTAAPSAGDPCTEATASVTVTDVRVDEDAVNAQGTWQVSGGADGVVLEYRIASDRLQAESQRGTSGSWEIATLDPEVERCGRFTLRVFAFPSVRAGERQLHCLKRGSSVPQQFEISCAPVAEIIQCDWECTGGENPACSGLCTGMARRGKLSYIPFWGVDGDGWRQGADIASAGPWTRPVTCTPGQHISFKVRNRGENGLWSEVDEIGCGVTE